MLLMQADTLPTRANGRGVGPSNRDFLGPVKWHHVVGAQKSLVQGPTPLPLAKVMDLPASKALRTGLY